MSAAEDDTELRDLLIQNLENSGVLNKLKAEMRAAVFLAMEEQGRQENKTPLVNENLKKCLNTTDGRLVASLIVDFLQVFNLDFTLAVFQPEINMLSGLDGRDQVCTELGLSESDLNRNSALLLELVRRRRPGGKPAAPSEDPSPRQITLARKKFDLYDKDRSGSLPKEELKSVFTELLPSLSRNMLEKFIADELRAADRSFSKAVDVQLFLAMYRRLFSQCRSVVVEECDASPSPAERISCPPFSKIPRYKGHRHRGQSQTAAKDSERAPSVGKGDFQQQTSSALRQEQLDLEGDEDPDDGDSFFDDPLPKPQKTYGCNVPLEEERPSVSFVSPLKRGRSLGDLSLLVGDSEGEQDKPLCELRKSGASGARGSPPGSLSESPRPGGAGAGGGSTSELSVSRNGASDFREKGFKGLSDKTGSLHLDDDMEYDDDFNSHRSELSKSDLSIGEEIEEVSIEGPDRSEKFDESTQDLSVSQLSQSHGADYMEDVA